MDEEELTEVLLPANNKYVKEFLVFPQEKQLQILKLGLSTYNYSSHKFKSVIDGEKEDIIDKLTQQHTKDMDHMCSTQSDLLSTIQELKKTNKEHQRDYKDTLNSKIHDEKELIKQSLERLYGEKINNLTKKLELLENKKDCLLYTSPSPRDAHESRMPSSA